MRTNTRSDVNDDFSLASGGRFYELLRRVDGGQKLPARIARRLVLVILIAWVPLLLLSLIQGSTLGLQEAEPLIHDLETNIRLLVVVPLLIIAEFTVDPKLASVIKQFNNSGLIGPGEQSRFESAVAATERLRDSRWIEAALLVVALVISYYSVKVGLHDGRASWLATVSGTTEHMTAAGWWFCLISGPLQRFVLYCWVWRLLIWCGLLWRISRMDLLLMPTHPDRAGGLGFFGHGQVAFVIVIVAASTIASAHVGERVIWQSADLSSYKVLLFAFAVLCVALILGPLLVFSGKLWDSKVRGLQEYGVLGQKYTQSFDQKWIRGGAAKDEPLLGTADLQSLADLGNSYQVISDMKIVPVTFNVALTLMGAAVVPLLPLLLFRFSPADLLWQILTTLA